jgi:DNA-directed RNA polymerase specialized sigma24 family protein
MGNNCNAEGSISMVDETQALTDYDDSYALFERAVVGRDESAWAELYARYHRLVSAWVRRCGAFARLNESSDDLADQAFTRAWMALSPAQFARFPTISALLAYLRCCATTVVLDMARAQMARERVATRLEANVAQTLEEDTLDQIDGNALWKLCWRITESELERVVLYEIFSLALPPREVQARHRDLFPDVTAVYATKRNLMERLKRNQAIRALRVASYEVVGSARA